MAVVPGFLEGRRAAFGFGQFVGNGILPLMVVSSAHRLCGPGAGMVVLRAQADCSAPMIQMLWSGCSRGVFHALAQRLYVDEFYELSVIRMARWSARVFNWMDRWFGTALFKQLRGW